MELYRVYRCVVPRTKCCSSCLYSSGDSLLRSQDVNAIGVNSQKFADHEQLCSIMRELLINMTMFSDTSQTNLHLENIYIYNNSLIFIFTIVVSSIKISYFVNL